jgi:hypothetical protein
MTFLVKCCYTHTISQLTQNIILFLFGLMLWLYDFYSHYCTWRCTFWCHAAKGSCKQGAKHDKTNFFIIKPTRCTNFTNLFWRETLHVSDSFSVHHQEFIHCTLSNGICHTAFEQDQDGTEFHPGPAEKLSTNLYDIDHCWVYSE